MVVTAADRAFNLAVKTLSAFCTSRDPKCLIKFVLVHFTSIHRIQGLRGPRVQAKIVDSKQQMVDSY